MLSPDPVTQTPENGQNYNRYSYAYNNPLKYTDPSGFTYCEIGSCDRVARDFTGQGTQPFLGGTNMGRAYCHCNGGAKQPARALARRVFRTATRRAMGDMATSPSEVVGDQYSWGGVPTSQPVIVDSALLSDAFQGYRKVESKISDFMVENPGEPIPITSADLASTMLFEAMDLGSSFSGNYFVDALQNADGFFFGSELRGATFTIANGPLEGTYLGSDINYYYTGFVAASYGITQTEMFGLIALWNGGQAISELSQRQWDQIAIGIEFASVGYNYYMSLSSQVGE